ncbi:MAG: hypothetical protein OXB86_00015 [Bdellovibrionales bacterium]|nr:hypothetical protein [Bdellovibrionales bacterium]
MRPKTSLYLVGFVFFILSQGAFSAHQLTHFEETDHQEECLICHLDCSAFCDSPPNSASFVAFKNISYGEGPLIFIKKSFYSQLFPRPPPLK